MEIKGKYTSSQADLNGQESKQADNNHSSVTKPKRRNNHAFGKTNTIDESKVNTNNQDKHKDIFTIDNDGKFDIFSKKMNHNSYYTCIHTF